MKKLISILMAFSIIFTNVSQNRMFVVLADKPTSTPSPVSTLKSSEQITNLDDIGVLTLLRELIFRVVGGTIGAIGKAFVYSSALWLQAFRSC